MYEYSCFKVYVHVCIHIYKSDYTLHASNFWVFFALIFMASFMNWGFPELGVPLVIIHFSRIFPFTKTIQRTWGTPMTSLTPPILF